MAIRSNLEKILRDGVFAITAEIGPPKGMDPNSILKKVDLVKGSADAFNITDNQTGVVRLSSLAGCVLLLSRGVEPVMQLTCRDRNRIALQSDILGAAALGVKNVLCLTGDHQKFGNHPQAKGVFDLDSVQLIEIVHRMCSEGIFQNGEPIIAGKPDLFIGGAANPFSDPFELSVNHVEKKIIAGVDFIQTQSVYNLDGFYRWMDEIRSRGFDKKVFILAGVTPLKSVKMTERMKFHVPGVDVPDEVYIRMQRAADPKQEGFLIARETLEQLRKIPGVHGVHITALFWEEVIPQLVRETGFFPRIL
ncbi:MAG: methylenetetrahydrofolate reductase [Candidatus Thermoplasmatota archaeon]